MVGQPEVVVRGERDDLATVDDRDGTLLVAHDPERPGEVLRPELLELGGQLRQRVGHASLQSMMTLPESPERAAANAASNSRNGKRWVIAGLMSSPDCTRTRILYQLSYISRP